MGAVLERQKLGTNILVVNPDGQILLGRRLSQIKNGFYGTPGGHLEIGESPLVNARKELREETGMDILDLVLIALILDHQNPPVNDFLHFVYLVQNVILTPVLAEPDKCAGWNWYAPDNLPTPVIPANLAAIRHLAARQENAGIGFLEISTRS